ncbi:MAG: hypothetical protein SGARI_002544 [Bacillariaceae sp.]
MAKKAREEDLYYRQCQKEAMSKKHDLRGVNTKSESELFQKQGVAGINFAKYDSIQVDVRQEGKEGTATAVVMKSFDDLTQLTPQLQRNIALMNYQHPTPIQRHALPHAMVGEDLMCCAQTGSGKTCAFLLPVCAALAAAAPDDGRVRLGGNEQKTAVQSAAKPRCVVLAPTRELASQIELEAQKLTHKIPNMTPVCVYGGANPRSQLRELAYASSSGSGSSNEADRMLDMGFEPQIRKLVQKSGMTPKQKRQTLLFSATFPPQIQKLAAEFLRPSYVWIAVGKVGSTTDSITQVLVQATPDKRRKLQLVVQALTNGPAEGRTLIFVQKKRTATWLKKQLGKGGPDDGKPHERFAPIRAVDIHGDRSQSQREAALASFRSGECRVLYILCFAVPPENTVAARGLDIGVEHVINMDLPNSREDFDSYVHRIGRTGRAGHVGLATSLFVPGDDPKVANGRIAQQLITLLRESDQTVPEWLEEQVAGGGGKATPAKRKEHFSNTDVRRNGGRGRGNGSKQTPRSTTGGRGRSGRGRGGKGGGRGGQAHRG